MFQIHINLYSGIAVRIIKVKTLVNISLTNIELSKKRFQFLEEGKIEFNRLLHIHSHADRHICVHTISNTRVHKEFSKQ